MLNIASIFLGLIALLFVIPGLIPLLGWANWISLPIAIFGGALGAMSSSNMGRNLNIFILIVATLRLMIGGGII
ncbi:hypothetical protein KCG44_07585 [Pacificimonas sp. WHA3]|uniref:Transmembrane protein n=1 Tax=Pacificimonas pallii TaxID=2827236 RepID=A0ABS6SE55_9SPHN|nr:hypothetical protein [Pacificimonas pallii]MBV7256645.1 hypothetical protein [Pacificimonas pallii]